MRKQEIIRRKKGEKSVNHGGQCLNLNVHLALYLTLILEIISFIMNTLKPYSVRNRNWYLHSSQFGNRSTVLCTNGMAVHVHHSTWKVSSDSYSCYDQHETHNIWRCSMNVWMCMCVYVCMDVHVCVCMYGCVYICIYVCYVYMYVMHVCTYVWMPVLTNALLQLP
jgi:hypothetical protein